MWRKKKKKSNIDINLNTISGFFHELNEYYFGDEKIERNTPLNDDEKIELACQLNKLWIKK